MQTLSLGAKRHSLIATYTEQLGHATVRHHARVALQAAQVEVELARRSRSEFIANMSHELRTPLNAIVGFSEVLHRNPSADSTEIAQYAAHIKDAAGHLLALVNRILDLSKIQSGMLALDRQVFPLGDVARSAVAIVAPQASENGITLVNEIAAKGVTIHADPVRVKQILLNLLSNALKFTPAGGRITLSATTGRGTAEIVVADTGIGMAQEEIDIALKPFGQVRRDRMRSQEGLGLGLSITRAIARLHGGDVAIDSRQGAGTRVKVRLPLRDRQGGWQ